MNEQPISLVIFTSNPIGVEYLKILHSNAHINNMAISMVITCKDNRNPYYSIERKDEISDFCNLNNIRTYESPDAIFNHNFDLGISYGNYFILNKNHINCFNKGIINFHGADIRKYKGSAAPVFHILENDVNEFGYAYHLISEKLDEGEILFEKKFGYERGFSSRQINLEVVKESIKDMPDFIKVIRLFIDNKITLRKNDSSSPARKRQEIFGKEEMNFTIDNLEIDKFLRAFDWPEIFKHPLIKVNDKKVRLVPDDTYEEMLSIYREFKYKV